MGIKLTHKMLKSKKNRLMKRRRRRYRRWVGNGWMELENRDDVEQEMERATTILYTSWNDDGGRLR